ncbi:prostasin-like [Clytia hemisphaerica]|uniref:Uncharacterized protein n=1 Tax=Clytia hemisphaerica TaxID=252671 RepID=A0A7M5XC13_9CNID|eukprot:TCONS_00027381-protein
MVVVQLFWCIIYCYLLQAHGKALPKSLTTVNYDNPLHTVPCNFEMGAICAGYERDSVSPAKWLIQQGATSSQDTGPSFDNTLGKGQNGWYMYLETSNQLSGKVATIQTVLLDHQVTQGKKLCLSFYYHMYGHTMGDFNIHVDVPEGNGMTKHFELKGNQKQRDWQFGRFAFDTPQKPFKIVFKGTTSFSYFGDIGLDDIDLKLVSSKSSCDFWPTNAATTNNNAIPTLPLVTIGPNGIPPVGNGPSKCGRRQVPVGRIFNGQNVYAGKWPWMAMVLRQQKDGTYKHMCGGALYGGQYVITAAHCLVETKRNSHIRVRLGAHLRKASNANQQDFDVSAIYIHTDYKKKAWHDNDIALLKLDKPVITTDYIQPICLTDNQINPGAECVVTGWGEFWAQSKDSETFNYAHQLKEARVELKSMNQCKKVYHDSLLTKNMLCAGPYNDNFADTCRGDSGGPLMCKNNDKSWSLVGVTSWGHSDGCGQPDKFGVYTKMSETSSWITHTTLYPHLHPTLHGEKKKN